MPYRDPERSRVVAELAIAAVGIGTYDWDLVEDVLVWDDQLLDLFGYTRETFPGTIAGFYARVHPDDVPPVREALERAAAECGDYLIEYRVLPHEGEVRWVSARGRMLPGPDGTAVRAVGAATDMTEREATRFRVARILEAMPTAFYSLDPDWRITYVNAQAELVLGRRRADLLGRSLWEAFPAALGSDFETHYRHAVATGEPVRFDAYYPAPLHGWYEVRAWPSAEGLSVYFLDVTAWRETQSAAERAAERAALVARVTAELAETLDAAEAVARLAQLVVPALADWCVVTLVDEPAPGSRAAPGLRDVGTWHVDEDRRPLVAEYASQRLRSLRDHSFLNRSLASASPVLVPGDATAAIHAVLLPGRAQDVLLELAPASAAVLPMRARGRTLGALSLFNGPGRDRLTPEDLVTVEEVAGRAGLALDNSRLYDQQRQRAETFQRSLLTRPAQPDHLEIAVRYVPAAEAAQVGGDWYDAFLQPSGATMLVIGDVVGHDVEAAAAMGQVRSVLRGVAVATGAGPADLLGQVDRALRTLQADTIATALVARLEQTDEERRDGTTRLRWSSAGHPGPMVVDPDGTVHHLAPATDPLLGVLPDSPRHDVEAVLERGSTVLLYTDGLVERRDRGLRRGFAVLRDTLEELASRELDLDTLCDQLLERMLPPRSQDDVALVAVRLHRQDQPRPPEAGPPVVPPDVPEEPEVAGPVSPR